MTKDPAWVRQLALDYRNAQLNDSDRALLDYADTLTRSPKEAARRGVGSLRKAGFDDRGILDACSVTAYYGYVNRLAEGLGVELEATWSPGDLTITREEFDRP